jgi:C4-dicarboxylate-specific signal transduction histidine kinase
MQFAWRSRFWRSAVVCLGGGLVTVLLAYACFAVAFDFASAGFTLLILTALLSLVGRVFDSIVISVVSIFSLDYFFIRPLFSFGIADWDDAVAMAAFLVTSLIITGLAARMRRLAQQELRQTRAALARFARVATLGEMTASIAHEVNQPLAGVVSSGNACLRWLATEPPNVEKASQSVHRIIRDANRASQVVERVRGLIKNTPPQKTWININEAILEITVLVRSEIEHSRISLATRLQEDLPPVWADRIQLQQVLLNLIANAIDAMRAANLTQRDLLIATEPDKTSWVLVTVRDSGAGLDAAKLQDMFNAFYTTKPEGIGMGLAISRSIVEAHGGRLWATPGKSGGATFQLTLPTIREEPA